MVLTVSKPGLESRSTTNKCDKQQACYLVSLHLPYLQKHLPHKHVVQIKRDCVYKIISTGNVVKIVEKEDPELTSSHRHTKIKTIYIATIEEKDRNLPEKIFYN